MFKEVYHDLGYGTDKIWKKESEYEYEVEKHVKSK